MSIVTWTPTILAGGTPSQITLAYTFNANALDLALPGLSHVESRDAVTGGVVPGASFSIFVVPANLWSGDNAWSTSGRRFTLPQGAQAPFGIQLVVAPSPSTFDLTTISAVSWIVTLPA